MKAIFLDHDGVICLSTEWGGRLKKQSKWGGRKLSMTLKEILAMVASSVRSF